MRNFEKLRVCKAKEQRIFEKIDIFLLHNIAFKVTYKEELFRKMILEIYTPGSGSGCGSKIKNFGSEDPDPDPIQNILDPQHCNSPMTFLYN